MKWIFSTLALASVAGLATLGVDAGMDHLATGQLYAGVAAFTGAVLAGITQFIASA